MWTMKNEKRRLKKLETEAGDVSLPWLALREDYNDASVFVDKDGPSSRRR